MMALDPTRQPFEESDLPPNRLPALNARASSSSSSAICLPPAALGSGSAPPTRGIADRTAMLSPLLLPSPPGTDPPRRLRRKKKGASTACLPPAAPDSPFPFPPSMEEAKRVLQCSDPRGSAGDDGRERPEEFPPAPTRDELCAESPLFVTPGSRMLEDIDRADDECAHINDRFGALGAASTDLDGVPEMLSQDEEPEQHSLARFVSGESVMTEVPEERQRPAPWPPPFETAQRDAPGARGRSPSRGGEGESFAANSDGITSSFLQGFLGSGTLPGARGGPKRTPASIAAAAYPAENLGLGGAPGRESSESLQGCFEPLLFLKARPDCDYWDRNSQSDMISARSRLADSVDGFPRRAQISIGSGTGKLDSDETMWSIERDDVIRGDKFSWVRGELLGRGSLGSVWKALDRCTGQLMAVKEVLIDTRDSADDKFRNALQHEIEMYQGLDHPHIVRYLGNDYLRGRLYIYLEYMSGGSIAQVLSQFGPLEEPLIARYTRDLLEGLEYLHSQTPVVLHRDIKGANILVGLDREVKLSDFGCSKRTEGTMVHTLRGSVPWMAPEVMRQSGYGRKADIWSLGCVIIEMATAAQPWGSFDNHLAAMVRIAMSDETPEIPKHLSPLCQEVISRCTRRSPQERPCAWQLLAHDFVAGALAHTAVDDSWGN